MAVSWCPGAAPLFASSQLAIMASIDAVVSRHREWLRDHLRPIEHLSEQELVAIKANSTAEALATAFEINDAAIRSLLLPAPRAVRGLPSPSCLVPRARPPCAANADADARSTIPTDQLLSTSSD